MTAALSHCLGPDLDAATLYRLLALRAEVFVVEQNCPYLDLDGQDLVPETRHYWLADEAGRVISTLRLMDHHGIFWIGRVCTAADERGHGHTARLMQAALAEVGGRPCRLNAQAYLTGMYTRHGFAVDGAEFVEDGIPHVPMLRPGCP